MSSTATPAPDPDWPDLAAAGDNPEAMKARLKAAFPSWSIIHTDRGRWWATRPTLVREDLSHTAGATIDADTASQLYFKLKAAER